MKNIYFILLIFGIICSCDAPPGKYDAINNWCKIMKFTPIGKNCTNEKIWGDYDCEVNTKEEGLIFLKCDDYTCHAMNK